MPKFNQRGAAHLVAPIIILIGILATYYLATHPAIFKPKAAFDPASAITVKVNGAPVSCSNKICEVDSSDPNFPVEFSIDVDALNVELARDDNSAARGGRAQ
ncbi:hypothetical protein A3C26_03600 [Candidatus Daviesbacteria bacterium RIFCSPHIGHO2_02_FULL_39_12]|uniref:Uncharacterized protein n=2 Tax=Candidatus Daviesiibacteriota TaxID=1752718 RepID=A0A1F5JAI1_9BACT|nr:MAG: hypothetical protein A3C26_03600 [Candidatus Daviesbacteria bacterium RIFCSPHIGHO2_02_FULL_39_12]OGE72826.1 MAG: hypothetical protein A3H40_02050 [Candidatus Daviesbacteria bacterium RIFCSPLOWO2_02_FULL_38_15]